MTPLFAGSIPALAACCAVVKPGIMPASEAGVLGPNPSSTAICPGSTDPLAIWKRLEVRGIAVDQYYGIPASPQQVHGRAS